MSCLISSCTSEMIDSFSTKPTEIINTLHNFEYLKKLCKERGEEDYHECANSVQSHHKSSEIADSNWISRFEVDKIKESLKLRHYEELNQPGLSDCTLTFQLQRLAYGGDEWALKLLERK